MVSDDTTTTMDSASKDSSGKVRGMEWASTSLPTDELTSIDMRTMRVLGKASDGVLIARKLGD